MRILGVLFTSSNRFDRSSSSVSTAPPNFLTRCIHSFNCGSDSKTSFPVSRRTLAPIAIKLSSNLKLILDRKDTGNKDCHLWCQRTTGPCTVGVCLRTRKTLNVDEWERRNATVVEQARKANCLVDAISGWSRVGWLTTERSVHRGSSRFIFGSHQSIWTPTTLLHDVSSSLRALWRWLVQSTMF